LTWLLVLTRVYRRQHQLLRPWRKMLSAGMWGRLRRIHPWWASSRQLQREGDEQPESAAESNGNMDLLPTGAGMDKEVTFLQKLRFKKMQYNAIKPRYVPALIVL
jgi:hypothetical protein